MILVALMLMQAAYPPETEAVMGRTRPKPDVHEGAAEGARALSLHLPPEVAKALQTCLDNAVEDPDAGLRFAAEWEPHGGGFSAGQCRGFAFSRAERWDEAAAAFSAAAALAVDAGAEADASRLWVQAGNAALAGGKAEVARSHFDKAFAQGMPDGLVKGEAYLDRARALVALGDMVAARSDLDEALKLAAADPLAWLLSATLARRMDDFPRARKDILEARTRAPNDPYVLFEQGNILMTSGDGAAAKAVWQKLLSVAPDSEPAGAAREMLSRLNRTDRPSADQSR